MLAEVAVIAQAVSKAILVVKHTMHLAVLVLVVKEVIMLLTIQHSQQEMELQTEALVAEEIGEETLIMKLVKVVQV